MMKILLVSDAARLLRCSPSRVSQLADRGELNVLGKTPRGVRVFLLDEVEKFARERELQDKAAHQ